MLALRVFVAGRARRVLIALVVVSLLAVLVRVAAEPVPAAVVRFSVPVATGRTALVLPWPPGVQAALVVPGVGTVGVVGGQRPVPIASLAKVMTALVVLADHPLTGLQPGPVLTITAAQARDFVQRIPSGQSLLAVKAGERLTERQALEGLLLPSADNVADVLADWDGGRPAFLAKMNGLAHRLGVSGTVYIHRPQRAGPHHRQHRQQPSAGRAGRVHLCGTDTDRGVALCEPADRGHGPELQQPAGVSDRCDRAQNRVNVSRRWRRRSSRSTGASSTASSRVTATATVSPQRRRWCRRSPVCRSLSGTLERRSTRRGAVRRCR